MYLEYAEDEFLAPDVVELSQLTQDEVRLTVRTEPQAVHGWQLLPDFLPESKRSISALAAWSLPSWDCLPHLTLSSASSTKASPTSISWSVAVSGGANRKACGTLKNQNINTPVLPSWAGFNPDITACDT